MLLVSHALAGMYHLLVMLSSPTAASRTVLLELALLGHSLHVLLHLGLLVSAASGLHVYNLGHECGVCL